MRVFLKKYRLVLYFLLVLLLLFIVFRLFNFFSSATQERSQIGEISSAQGFEENVGGVDYEAPRVLLQPWYDQDTKTKMLDYLQVKDLSKFIATSDRPVFLLLRNTLDGSSVELSPEMEDLAQLLDGEAWVVLADAYKDDVFYQNLDFERTPTLYLIYQSKILWTSNSEDRFTVDHLTKVFQEHKTQ